MVGGLVEQHVHTVTGYTSTSVATLRYCCVPAAAQGSWSKWRLFGMRLRQSSALRWKRSVGQQRNGLDALYQFNVLWIETKLPASACIPWGKGPPPPKQQMHTQLETCMPR